MYIRFIIKKGRDYLSKGAFFMKDELTFKDFYLAPNLLYLRGDKIEKISMDKEALCFCLKLIL